MKESKISEKCRIVYERLNGLRESLGWDWNKLYREARDMTPYDERDSEFDYEEEENKWCDKYKKIIQQRKNWERNKATELTLNSLRKLWELAQKMPQYKLSQSSMLSPASRAKMREVAAEGFKELKEAIQPDEEEE